MASLLCLWCARDEKAREAYFVAGGESLCIRHAADATWGEDDMRAHNLAHAAYLQLRERGVTDAY